MGKIKGLLFDLDDTLADREKTVYDLFYLLIKSNSSFSDEKVKQITKECVVLDNKGDTNKKVLIDYLQDKYKINLEIEDIRTWWITTQCEYEDLYPNVYELLNRLKDKYLLGIVTNGSIYGQYRKIERMKIQPFFHTIIISEEVNCQKPDKRIFEIALEKMGLQASEVLMIGDNMAKDILGASSCGITGVLIGNSNSNVISIASVLEIEKVLVDYF